MRQQSINFEVSKDRSIANVGSNRRAKHAVDGRTALADNISSACRAPDKLNGKSLVVWGFQTYRNDGGERD